MPKHCAPTTFVGLRQPDALSIGTPMRHGVGHAPQRSAIGIANATNDACEAAHQVLPVSSSMAFVLPTINERRW